jgi:ATP-binding cassette subfamily B protein
VLEDGRIAESGGHDDLVRRGGVYARMFETQARSYR